MKRVKSDKYRTDIDGLRAIAVIPVILFHLNFLPNGYLGVDVFFVISGFLITGIIYKSILNESFSILSFYQKRTRRIIPLVSFVSIIALIIGILTMLPDDLENLAQSVVATNIFSNNILPILTTKNYWDIVNEFKPLMHTWSLGIEEQYYLLYPFIFLLLGKKRIQWILPTLIVLTAISLALFFLNFAEYQKFYLLQFRFFELSIGGIVAILMKSKVFDYKFNFIPIILLILLVSTTFFELTNSVKIILTVLFSVGILISYNQSNFLSNALLNNRLFIFIGKISFSLYMWHQIVFAFSRYFIFQEIGPIEATLLIAITVILSILTYYFIEQPFRNLKAISNKIAFTTIIGSVIFSTAVSLYIYSKAGVLKNIPELEISTNNIKRNIHAGYNDRIYQLNQGFTSSVKKKVLIIGNSFARDWGNILLESKYSDKVEIHYTYHPKDEAKFKELLQECDIIFVTMLSTEEINHYIPNQENMWYVGTKNFGINNGFYYNYKGNDYCLQRTKMEKGYLEENQKLKDIWNNKYIDLIEPVIDQNKMPVFTKDCKFISQDCRHLTQAGAKFYSVQLNHQLYSLLADK